MFVRRERCNSLKLLLWFLLQRPLPITPTTHSISVTYPSAVISDCRDWLADFLNRRRDNRRAVGGVMKFQLHAATDVTQLDHGTTQGRARDGYLDWLRTVLRMSGDQRRTFAQKLCGVEVVLSANLQHGIGRQTCEEHASLDFGLNDLPIHLVAEVGMRREHDSLYCTEFGRRSQHLFGVHCEKAFSLCGRGQRRLSRRRQ